MAEQARVSASGGLVELYATATVRLTAQGGYTELHSMPRVAISASGVYAELTPGETSPSNFIYNTAHGGYIELHGSPRVENTAAGAYVESYVPFYRVRLFVVALATLTANVPAVFSDVRLYMPTAASAMLVPLPLNVRTVNASILRLPYANAAQLDDLVLLQREVVYDTTNDEIRYGDGNTRGGFRLAKRNAISGTFTTADGKIIYVEGGMIVEISEA